MHVRKDIELTKEEIEKLIIEKLKIIDKLKIVGKGSIYIQELSELAFLQLEIEQYFKAEKNFAICLNYFNQQLDRLGQGAVLGILGTSYFKKGEYQKSIENYRKAFEIYQKLNQFKEQITCLKGIGNNYFKLDQLDNANDAFLDCCAVCADNNDIYNLLDCLGNLVHIHEKQENWDIVFELYKKTLKAFKELKDNQGIIVSYFNLGILKKKECKNDKALKYFKKGTNQAIDSNYAELIMKGLSYVAESLFYLGKIKDAKNELIRALHLANKMNAKNAKIQIIILLKSFGLADHDIKKELEEYNQRGRNTLK